MKRTAALVGGLTLACSGLPTAPAAPPPPNLLVVVLDDVGRQRIRALGGGDDGPPLPTLETLAHDGLRFSNVWSNPLCSPTRTTIMTGRYSRRAGIGTVVDSWSADPELDPAEITIPEMLTRSAWTWDTSQAGKWHLGSHRTGLPETHPGRQGFGWWAGTLGNLRDPYHGGKSDDWGYFTWMKDDHGHMREARGYVTTDTADDAIGRIRAMKEPWFLYLAFNAAHVPTHLPPAELRSPRPLDDRSNDADRYDAMVEAVDHELGRVLAAMSPELRARTWVFVVGDNGIPDFAVHAPADASRAKGTVYQLGVDVPLIVTGPGVPANARSDALVNTVDLFATVAAIAQVDPKGLGVPIDGVSLLPVLQDPTASVRRYAYTEQFAPNGPPPYHREEVAVRDARYTLIEVHGRKEDSTELYDLQQDPTQDHDLLKARKLDPEVQAAYDALQAELARIRGSM